MRWHLGETQGHFVLLGASESAKITDIHCGYCFTDSHSADVSSESPYPVIYI